MNNDINEDQGPPGPRRWLTTLFIVLGVLPGFFFSALSCFAYHFQERSNEVYDKWGEQQLQAYHGVQIITIVTVPVVGFVVHRLYEHGRIVPFWCWVLLPVMSWLQLATLVHFAGQDVHAEQQAHNNGNDDNDEHVGVIWPIWALTLLPVVFMTMAALLGTEQEVAVSQAACPAYGRLEVENKNGTVQMQEKASFDLATC